MGAKNGAWCVGCCWALMASLFALGRHEHRLDGVRRRADRGREDAPWRRVATYGTAAILLALGVLLLAAPDAVPALTLPGNSPMPLMGQMGS